MESQKLILEGNNIKEVVHRVKRKLGYCYCTKPSSEVTIYINEKYYFRNNSDLMTMIIVSVKEEDKMEIEVVCGGGGEGLFRLDLGAEAKRIKQITRYFQEVAKELEQKLSIL